MAIPGKYPLGLEFALDVALLREKKLQAKIERLEEVFNDYGRHLQGCDAEYSNNYACTCGFEEAKKEQE